MEESLIMYHLSRVTHLRKSLSSVTAAAANVLLLPLTPCSSTATLLRAKTAAAGVTASSGAASSVSSTARDVRQRMKRATASAV